MASKNYINVSTWQDLLSYLQRPDALAQIVQLPDWDGTGHMYRINCLLLNDDRSLKACIHFQGEYQTHDIAAHLLAQHGITSAMFLGRLIECESLPENLPDAEVKSDALNPVAASGSVSFICVQCGSSVVRKHAPTNSLCLECFCANSGSREVSPYVLGHVPF